MRIFTSLIFLLFAFSVSGQDLLYSEDFNDCALPSDWTVNLVGNPNAAWWVGMPMNNNDDGSTIDGSCMLIFDDDLSGDQTPPWVLELTTPIIDVSAYNRLELSVDVHFRDYQNSASLEILVFNGSQYVPLRKYKGPGSQTGVQFSEYQTFTADLSFYLNPQLHLMFRYDDAAAFAWWAGIDNIRITGESRGANLILETFDGCALPDGWTTQYSGAHDWQFGFVSNTNTSTTSMNGSCMAYFDDDGIGQQAPYSVVRLLSPEIDGSSAAQMILEFDVILRRYVAAEHLAIGVLDVETGESKIAVQYFTDLGGPGFTNYVSEQVDLSGFRAHRMKVFFQYDDGSDWGWWVGIDNVRLIGEGINNETCANALPLTVGEPCTEANNAQALFDGPQPGCLTDSRAVASQWYTFTAPADGWLRMTSGAAFNDVVSLFTGGCESLEEEACGARDEHGFTGETHYAQVVAGQSYLLRLSGERARFGMDRGSFCLSLDYADSPPAPPANDLCEQAIALTIDGDCVAGGNLDARAEAPLPSRNTLARSDVWYRFTVAEDMPIEIEAQANFADVLTLYRGGCQAPEEVAINEYGSKLTLENPEPGATYLLKVSGAFATVEGELCARVRKAPIVAPANDLCPAALPVVIDGPCVYANNFGANFDGPAISCEPFLSGSIWFSFVAPGSGAVRFLPDADFAYALSVYEGGCGNLSEVFCSPNKPACEGYLTLGSLTPGQTYYIRLSSTANTAGFGQRGNVCLSIYNAAITPEWTPLSLQVDVNCFDNGLATLTPVATGGAGLYQFAGYDPDQAYSNGEAYLVVVIDANGCERSVSGEVLCEANPNCALAAELSLQSALCHDSANGAAAIGNLSGGSGEYQIAWSTGSVDNQIEGLAAGAYQVTVNDGSGCAIVLPFFIEAPAPLLLADEMLTPASNGQSNGAIAVVITGGTPPYSYNWLLNGASVGQTNDPIWNNAAPGDYQVEVADANGCVMRSRTLVVESIVSTSHTQADLRIDIAPNPTAGPLTLSWLLPTDRAVALRLYTAEGRSWRLARNLGAATEGFRLDLRDWPAGVYWLRWEDGRQTWERKIIKQ